MQMLNHYFRNFQLYANHSWYS